jgi:hypothetical protein
MTLKTQEGRREKARVDARSKTRTTTLNCSDNNSDNISDNTQTHIGSGVFFLQTLFLLSYGQEKRQQLFSNLSLK